MIQFNKFIDFKKSYLTKLMNDDMARKISDVKTPSENDVEIEEYENCVMEVKNQSVSLDLD